MEIVHELEIYVQLGFAPAEALAAATIVPAHLVGQETKTGSIKVGRLPTSRLLKAMHRLAFATCGRRAWSCFTANSSMPTHYAARRGFRGAPSRASNRGR